MSLPPFFSRKVLRFLLQISSRFSERKATRTEPGCSSCLSKISSTKRRNVPLMEIYPLDYLFQKYYFTSNIRKTFIIFNFINIINNVSCFRSNLSFLTLSFITLTKFSSSLQITIIRS